MGCADFLSDSDILELSCQRRMLGNQAYEVTGSQVNQKTKGYVQKGQSGNGLMELAVSTSTWYTIVT